MINANWIVIIIAVAAACLFFGILIGMAIADRQVKVLVKIEKDEFDDFVIKGEGTDNSDE